MRRNLHYLSLYQFGYDFDCRRQNKHVQVVLTTLDRWTSHQAIKLRGPRVKYRSRAP
jgi:hypothetical protein